MLAPAFASIALKRDPQQSNRVSGRSIHGRRWLAVRSSACVERPGGRAIGGPSVCAIEARTSDAPRRAGRRASPIPRGPGRPRCDRAGPILDRAAGFGRSRAASSCAVLRCFAHCRIALQFRCIIHISYLGPARRLQWIRTCLTVAPRRRPSRGPVRWLKSDRRPRPRLDKPKP